MRRLSKSLADLKLRYDVVVVGSGYGGGVAASRLSRAGKRVAVLERGREFAIGDFPDRFVEAQEQFQVSQDGAHVSGSRLGLYDLHLGKRHPRVRRLRARRRLADQRQRLAAARSARVGGPGLAREIGADQTRQEGFARAARGAAAGALSRHQAAAQAQGAGGQRQRAEHGRRAPADQRHLRAAGELRRRRAAGLHHVRRLLLRLQRRRQEHRAGHLPGRRLQPRRRDLHRGARIARQARARALARVLRADGPRPREASPRPSSRSRQTWSSSPPARSAPPRSCCARARRASPSPTSSASASPATATCWPSPTTTTCPSTASASAIRRRPRPIPWVPASPASSTCATRPSSRTAWSSRRARSPPGSRRSCRRCCRQAPRASGRIRTRASSTRSMSGRASGKACCSAPTRAPSIARRPTS